MFHDPKTSYDARSNKHTVNARRQSATSNSPYTMYFITPRRAMMRDTAYTYSIPEDRVRRPTHDVRCILSPQDEHDARSNIYVFNVRRRNAVFNSTCGLHLYHHSHLDLSQQRKSRMFKTQRQSTPCQSTRHTPSKALPSGIHGHQLFFSILQSVNPQWRMSCPVPCNCESGT